MNPSNRARRLPAAALFLSVVCGCSGAAPDSAVDAATDPPVDTGGDGADVSADDAADNGGDVDPEPDAADGNGPDSTPGTLGVGELCLSDRECASFLCFRFDAAIEEGFCTQYCSDNSNCPPDGFECVFLANSGGDFARICAPDNLCVDRDGDGFGVGPSCDGPDCDDLVVGIYLGADEVCDGVDNDCDGNIDENAIGVNTVCSTGFLGACATGRALCIDGLVDCVADRSAVAEVCDGVDNDCDGTIDEDETGGALTEVCYGGPPATADVGACRAGIRTCRDGVIGDCAGDVLPLVEICDGVDNDCDGVVDEGLPGAGQPCDVPDAVGVCTRGRTQCTGSGALVCVAERDPGAEVCDGLDNDCDGAVDEDAEGRPLRRACYGGPAETRGVGSCADGEQTCDGGDWAACQGALLPVAEVCNALDDDCDGDTDEDGAAGGFVCATGLLGACARGATVCTELGTECVQVTAESEEICDGVDNDCDGEVDEGPSGLPLERVCYGGPAGTAGVGICTAGVQVCGIDGFGLCLGEQRPEGEVCDGVDNDCDGAVDDDAAGRPIELTCYGGPASTEGVGACRAGVRACVDGELSDCIGAVFPFPEICDGVDNDCDALTDEGNPGGGIACATGLPGVCATGRTQCREAAVVCEPDVAQDALPEVCDGVDNDCDGLIDEGFSGLFQPCQVGRGECVALGIRVCDPSNPRAAPICNADEGEPTDELCNGRDDDCDGAVDEDYAGLGQVCREGTGECAALGFLVCNPDDASAQPVCNASPTGPTTERCNGVDDDCDGDVDNGFADLGSVCFEGDGACARAGRVVCDEDETAAPVCDATPGLAAAETCNGLDDNCDGTVDNVDAAPLCPLQAGVCAGSRRICAGAGGFLSCSSVNYGANYEPVELACDGLDNDCDGTVDNVDVDRDGDRPLACGGTDCDDRNPLVRRGLDEICGDGVDNDCDGTAENRDNDDDAFIAVACGGDDCNDAQRFAYPGNSEICGDGLDNDCDGSIDNRDDDGDSFLAVACGGTDCNDDDDRAFPGNPEICDGIDNDCNTLVDDKDADADGFLAVACGGSDCNDDDPLVSPAALEICGDGVNNDCAGGIDDRDVDGDTFLALACGGTDCGDDSELIYPGATELRDARDGDCDGIVDEGLIGPGELVITEIMKDPAGVGDTVGEWFEVYNPTAAPINLDSWNIADLGVPADGWTIRQPSGVIVAPGAYAVLCRQPDPSLNGGVQCDAGYDDFILANGDDEIVLSLAGIEIDRVEYLSVGGWPSPTGRSMSLRSTALSATDNNLATSWCSTPSELGSQLLSGDYATPGRANTCP